MPTSSVRHHRRHQAFSDIPVIRLLLDRHGDYPNGQTTNFSYYGNTGDQRLEEIQNLNPSSTVFSKYDYAYDAAGRITQWTVQTDTNDPLQYAFGYDRADQLSSAVQTDTTTSTVTNQYFYTYDGVGNRDSEQINTAVKSGTFNNLNQLTGLSDGGAVRFQGTISEPGTVTVNSAPAKMTSGTSFSANPVLSTGTNVVTIVATDGSMNSGTSNYQVVVSSGTGGRTLTYDANGCMTNNGLGQTYTWDAEKRLTAINYSSGTITQSAFTYDALGRRSQIVEMSGTSPVTTRNFLFFPGAAQPCEERDATNTVVKRFYAQGEQISGTNYYYTRDHLGSVREMTDGSGTIQARYDYDPCGRLTKISGSLDSDFAYAGYFNHLTSGLYLAKFRAYNPDLDRWISRDPLVEAEMRQGASLYRYVLNSPTSLIDPFGLGAWYSSEGGGHASIIVSDPSSKTGYSEYSYVPSTGGYNDPGATWNTPGDMNKFPSYPPSNGVNLNTTPQQDEQLRNAGDALKANPGTYNPITNNCATVARQILKSAGLLGGASLIITPCSLQDELTSVINPMGPSLKPSPIGSAFSGYFGCL